MQLNRFVALSGVCSRRKAVELIESGVIKVSGRYERKPGYRVMPTDQVVYRGRILQVTEDRVYLMLNKPSGFMTTRSDELGRPTIFDLCKRWDRPGLRMFPVGRLDRDSRGLLLLTNDGDMAHTLAHPRFEVKKTYRVKLHQPLEEEYATQLLSGVHLADGRVQFDELHYLSRDRTAIEVVLHSGKNRVVRRMFAHGGYHVRDLLRVSYAGLSVRGLAQGFARPLTKVELAGLHKKYGAEESCGGCECAHDEGTAHQMEAS